MIVAHTSLGTLSFRCPSQESARLPGQLQRTEPETRGWIDACVAADDCLWDIGAHIGTVALYTGLKVRGGRGHVLAFEPSAGNYAILNDNIRLNALGDQVDAYCVALTDRTAVGRFNLSDASAGGANHAFGDASNVYGAFTPAFSQAMIGFTVDDLVRNFGLRPPDHIKLDVDSIEEQILRGARETLPRVRSVLIEILKARSPAWKETVVELFHAAGLHEHPWNDSSGSGRNALFVSTRNPPANLPCAPQSEKKHGS